MSEKSIHLYIYKVKKHRRIITINDQIYYWVFSYRVIREEGASSNFMALSRLVFWTKNNKMKYTLLFKTWDDPVVGNPLHTGFPLKKNDENINLNLNLPGIVAQIISFCIQHYKIPEGKEEILLENGLEILNKMGFETDILTFY